MNRMPLPRTSGSLPAEPRTLLATGQIVRALREPIEAATGLAFGRPWRFGTTPVFWGHGGPAQLAAGLGRIHLVVAPGPLLTPYDTPTNVLASLRLSWGDTPFEAVDVDPEALRAARLFGRNRFGRLDARAVRDLLAGLAAPALILAEGDLARSSARLGAFLKTVAGRYPDETFLVAGSEGCPAFLDAPSPRFRIVSRPVDPWALFPEVTRVVVTDWAFACEARLAGVEVVCLKGTEAVPSAESPSTADLVRLRYGAGVRTFDPWTGAPIPFAEAIAKVAWLRERFADNDRPTVLVGISRWKRPALDTFLRGPYGDPIHTMTAEDAVAAAGLNRGRVLAWATRMPERLEPLCAAEELPLARIEDGFLRSVGLGASLQPGASIVVDDRGIYYDPRTESRLAVILREADFPADLVERARALREGVIARRLTKYNVGLSGDVGTWPTDRRIVLVPGQVEDDASVMHGSPVVRSNRDLLRAARARNPDAFLLYKPHPDVEAGFRPGAIPEDEALRLADRIVGGLSIVDLLDRAHHVETMTSLAGFEALIRGLTVAVHGRPFYAGWGLSEDLAPGADRGRRLALDELVAGALLLYPLYLDPVAMKPCSAEQLLDRLSAARDAAGPTRLALSGPAHLVMRARYALLNPIVRRLRQKRGIPEAEDSRR